MLWLGGLSTLAVLITVACAGEGSCPAGDKRCSAGAATAAVSKPGGATKEIPKADLITQEIDELRDFVQICKERINLLEELNRTVKSGMNLSLPEAHMRMLQQQLPLMSEVTSVDQEKAPTSSADDYLISKTIIAQEEPVSFVKFLSLRSPRASSSAPTASMSHMPQTLLVAVQADGGMRLYAPTGELVLSFPLGHDQPITNLAVSPTQDDYFVATADTGGIIRVHKINVRQRRAEKDKKNRTATEEKVSQFLISPANVTAQFATQMQVPAGGDGEPAKVTALAMATQQGHKYFVAGDAEGKLNVFNHNGSFVANLDASNNPGDRVDGLVGHMSQLMFYAGSEWGFVNLERLDVQHMECPGFDGRITSAVVDSQQASRVVVSDEDGTIWVFNVKEKKKCRLEHQFQKGATVAPIDLASIRGFTIALERASSGVGTASVLAVNMSHVGKRHDALAVVPSSVVWRTGRQGVRDWAVHKRHQQGDLMAFLSEDGRDIEVFELLMQVVQPVDTSMSDNFSNFKMPVIAVAIALVLGYQYMKNKGKFSGGGGGGGGGGGLGGGKFDAADLAQLRNKKKMAGMGAGGGLGGKGGGRPGGLGGMGK